MEAQIQTSLLLSVKKKIDFRVNVKLSFKKKEFGSLLDTLIQSDGHVEQKAVISKDQHNK